MTLPSRDSGVFLYVGWRWLSGDIPYHDVWDHKPPLIYVIDAIGIKLTPDSLWGVWLIQLLFILATLAIIYILLENEFGVYAALGGSILLTSGLLTVTGSGNVTEEYALLFQVLCFALAVHSHKKDFPNRLSFWIGLCAGAAFNFKQTTIGILAVYALILIPIRISQRRFPIRDMVSMLAGWLIPSIAIAIYFLSQNALADFWEQAYLYNFLYIGKHEGIRRLIPVFTKGFLFLKNGWVLQLSFIGWLAGIVHLWRRRKEFFRDTSPLVLFAVINLPIEILLILVSGRSILHYYLTPLVVMGILGGVLIYEASELSKSFAKKQRLTEISLLLLILIAQYDQGRYYQVYMGNLAVDTHASVIQYVSENTHVDDQVLLIGAESVVNFLAKREAPSRFVYQYPLQLLGRRPMFEEFFSDIIENKPKLIIDTRGRVSLTEKLYSSMQNRSPLVKEDVAYLGEHYEPVAQFGEWIVYRFRP